MVVGIFGQHGGLWCVQLAQADVVVFPPHWCAFRGLAIIDNFDAHMELLRKLWVLMLDCLRMNFFSRLDVIDLYATVCTSSRVGHEKTLSVMVMVRLTM